MLGLEIAAGIGGMALAVMGAFKGMERSEENQSMKLVSTLMEQILSGERSFRLVREKKQWVSEANINEKVHIKVYQTHLRDHVVEVVVWEGKRLSCKIKGSTSSSPLYAFGYDQQKKALTNVWTENAAYRKRGYYEKQKSQFYALMKQIAETNWETYVADQYKVAFPEKAQESKAKKSGDPDIDRALAAYRLLYGAVMKHSGELTAEEACRLERNERYCQEMAASCEKITALQSVHPNENELPKEMVIDSIRKSAAYAETLIEKLQRQERQRVEVISGVIRK